MVFDAPIVVVDRHRELFLGSLLANDIFLEVGLDFVRFGQHLLFCFCLVNPIFGDDVETVGPAISFRTSCWLLPQKEQRSTSPSRWDISPPTSIVYQ